MAWALVVVLHG
jgi:hypothetical protein